jgi:hypothetical protein
VTHSASAGANSAAATAQALSGLLGQCVGEIVAWALSQPAPAQPAPAAASGSSTAVHR